MSRYIYLDAEIGGTGLYDLDGTEIDPQSLPLSSETRSLLSHMAGELLGKSFGFFIFYY